MFIDKNGDIYQGDMQLGDREATEQEIAEYLSNIEKEKNKQSILNQIAELEASQARPLRELEIARLLGEENNFAKEKVISINTQITELRAML